MIIEKYPGQLPLLSTEQMIEVDRLMIEHYGINLLQMMENAGRVLAQLAKERFLKNTDKVIVFAGTGGNGGGALVCARRLINWGVDVDVCLSHANKLNEVPAHQLHILEHMNAPIREFSDLVTDAYDLIVDGLIGYSLKGSPRGIVAEMIHWINDQKSSIISLDTPSGIELTNGVVHEPAVNANATLTLALPKNGLMNEQVKPLRGELYLGDISVPPELYASPSLALDVGPVFAKSDLLRID